MMSRVAWRGDDKCCGFGFKLTHRLRGCELDVLVLAAADAPFGHGELPWWPPWSIPFAWPAYRLSALWRRLWAQYLVWSASQLQPAYGLQHSLRRTALMWTSVFVIPEDIFHKVVVALAVMSTTARIAHQIIYASRIF